MKNRPWSVLMAGALAAGTLRDEVWNDRVGRHLSRLFTGGSTTPRRLRPSPSKYKPHQGAKECARRRRQLGLGEFGPGRVA